MADFRRFTITSETKKPGRKTTTEQVLVEVEVDFQKLALRLGGKAIKNNRGIATALGKAIKVRRVPTGD